MSENASRDLPFPLTFANCEQAFANSAYLSELWAVRDLRRQKVQFSASWNAQRENQLQDEARHARRFLDYLQKTSSPVVSDLSYSMQVRLYGPYVDLSATESVESAAAVHDLTEHRATWIYKTYLKHGRDLELKVICEEILEDEKTHFAINKGLSPSRDLQQHLASIDRKIFREELPRKFGRIMLFSEEFWKDYFQGATTEKN